ncbi:hypothetical protein [Actinoplanes sp. NPDC026670]|uniref:hypothetical protein n=1 Tax=Actinoplanes sp. NPDC026670 TaxID=3154700 RepID=UPI0033EA41CD
MRFNEPAATDNENRPDSEAARDSRKLINKLCLLRTAGGQWVFEHFVQRPPNEPEIQYSFGSDEDAAEWLLNGQMQNVFEHYFGAVENLAPEIPSSRIRVNSGAPIFFQPDAEISARIDSFAAAKGFDRRYALLYLLLEGINAVETVARADNLDTTGSQS